MPRRPTFFTGKYDPEFELPLPLRRAVHMVGGAIELACIDSGDDISAARVPEDQRIGRVVWVVNSTALGPRLGWFVLTGYEYDTCLLAVVRPARLPVGVIARFALRTREERREDRRKIRAAARQSHMERVRVLTAVVSDVVDALQREMGRRPAESQHYFYPRWERRRIVAHYRQARARGEVLNVDAWAQEHYCITGRTLSNYIGEFPGDEEG